MLQKRPLFFILSSIIAAYLAAFFLPTDVLPYVFCPLMLAAIICAFFWPCRRMGLLIFLPLALALLNHYFFTMTTVEPLRRFEGEEIELQGEIISEYTEGISSRYFILRPSQILFKQRVYDVNGDVIIYVGDDIAEFSVGSKISCYGNAFEDADEGFSIDHRITSRQFLSIYCTKAKLLESPQKINIYKLMADARFHIKKIYKNIFGQQVAGLLEGITLGSKDDISDSLYLNFRNSGVAHTLAVSGMHLSFLSVILWLLLSALCPNLNIRAVLHLILIWTFSALTGFSPSCIRATVMLSVFQVGVLVKRESDTPTVLALAVVLCCLRNPYAILNASLSLSVTATIGIYLLSTPISTLFRKLKNRKTFWGRIYFFLVSTVSVSAAAGVGTLPMVLVMFQSVSLLTPITNILIVPVVELLFFIALISVSFGWISPIAWCLKWVATHLYRYCDFMTDGISNIPYATVYTGSWVAWVLIFLVLGILFAVYFALHKRKIGWILPIYVCIFTVIIGCFCVYDQLKINHMTVDIVDVGQGNAALISRGHDAVMIDCGGNGTAYQEISRCISKNNICSLSSIYLTHMDTDHIKYLLPLIRTYSVPNLWIPKRYDYDDNIKQMLLEVKKRGTIIHYIDFDKNFKLWKLAELKVLAKHIQPETEDENESSLVYRLSYGNDSVLFTGDVEKEGEKRLYQKYRSALESDVLIVAHHGSSYGSSVEFLSYVNARVGIISVAADNSYNLPADDALRRVKEYTTTLLRTDRDGTISILMNGQRYQIKR